MSKSLKSNNSSRVSVITKGFGFFAVILAFFMLFPVIAEMQNVDDIKSALLSCLNLSFATATGFSVGTHPDYVAVGDLNGDGKLDMAVVNEADNNVSILLGTGAGSFNFSANYPVAGPRPQSVSLSDFNGDGKTDLAVPNADSNLVSILLGNGNGSFGTATNFAVGAHPEYTAVGDFNGDGKSDIAVPNQNANNVSILLGAGDGTFGLAGNFAVGAAPRDVSTGDFNNDGKLDIATANINADNVSVLLGNGDGSFGTTTNFTTGSQPSKVAVGDFNNDGKADLAVSNYGSQNVSIFLGTGTGSFNPANNYAEGSSPTFVTTTDLNADGALDLIFSNHSNTSILTVLLGTGTGSFGSPNNFNGGAIIGAYGAVAIGDFNGDSKPDVAVTSFNTAEASVFLNTTTPCSPTYTISGNVQSDGVNLAGATVALSGSQSASTTTDANGNYSFTANTGGDYTVTVFKNGYVFNPASQTVTNLQSNQTVNFNSPTNAPLCTLAPSGLVGFWKGENNGSDSSGINNNGTLNNGVGFTTGKVGQAFNFDGNDDRVTIPNNSTLNPTTQLSLAAWIRPNNLNSANQSIISKYDSSTNQISYYLYQYGGTIVLNIWGSNGQVRGVQTNNVLTANVFTHVAATFDTTSQNIKIYINGVETPTTLVNTGTINTIFNSSSPVLLGAVYTGTYFYFLSGLMDEAQIYNRALTAAEVQNIYNSGSAGVCAVPITGNGFLDPTFNGTGRVITPINNSDDLAYSVKIQPDGKIVTAGYSYNGSNYDFALTRNNADGTPDSSFGNAGKVTTPIGSSTDIANSVAIQSDGKIVAAGYSYDPIDSNNIALVRYNSDGSLDSSFGTGGKVITAPSNNDDTATSVAIQSDGKIVVAGYSYRASDSYNIIVARYNSNGSLDTSFGANGYTITATSSGTDIARSVAIQSDGKIVAAGYSYNGSSNRDDFVVVRYNTDGSLDTSFGLDGYVTSDFGGSGDQAQSVAIQNDGKIVAGGYRCGSTCEFILARYATNGPIDTSFGTGGNVTTQFGNSDIGQSVAIQADGKIISAGYAYNNISGNNDFALARHNSNGTLDTSFGTGGKIVSQIGNSNDYANSAAIQPDGKIVVAGYSYNVGNSSNDFAIARFDPNGGGNTFVSPAFYLGVNFASVTQAGNTVATPLTSAQLPALPNGLNFYSGATYYDIRTSAVYSGNITVTENVQSVPSAAACSNLRLYHYENGAWTMNTNSTPSYNSVAMVCTLTQSVTSLSPFAVVEFAPTAANVSVSGRIATPKGSGIRNVSVTLIDAEGRTHTATTGSFGYYRFDDIPLGTAIISVSAKRYRFDNSTQIINVADNISDIDFTAIE